MIDRKQLLADLKPLLKQLEADLRLRCDEVAEINARLQREYQQARDADRTGAAFEEWRADLITQVAVAWVLSCVFVRFLEDNGLISPPRISGRAKNDVPTGGGMARARDERDLYFRSHPKDTDRDYLLAVFDELANLPGTKDVFGPHNPVSADRHWLSGDAAQKLIEFFQKIDKDESGEIIHDFSDPSWDTRFLGDLYQDLSEAARKKYALLQTPVFVEEFILERTLEPAINEFGLRPPLTPSLRSDPVARASSPCPPTQNTGKMPVPRDCDNVFRQTPPGEGRGEGVFKMIDPACGSGHFLLGAFARILQHWRTREPGTSDRELVNRTLASIHGVDLNPYAVAIARFRLLIAAIRECESTRLQDAPAFAFNLVCGDSLLHGTPGAEQEVLGFHELAHVYQSEDLPELRRILQPGAYHAVVANPPYILPSDPSLNNAYREGYPEVCYRGYSLAVPFTQRLLSLARTGGFVGQITASSFMKREFGKRLVESLLPKVDVTCFVDTSGAYIPHHGNPEGTPTCLLFFRQQVPVAPTVRAVIAVKTDRDPPSDLAQASGWRSIVEHIDQPGFHNQWVEVQDLPRDWFSKHPWSLGGGGAAELIVFLNETAPSTLRSRCDTICSICITRENDAYFAPKTALMRHRIGFNNRIVMVEGEQVRNWVILESDQSVFPYDDMFRPVSYEQGKAVHDYLWCVREFLWRRKELNGDHRELGRTWWEWNRFLIHRYRVPMSIGFPLVATHNHFVLSRGGRVFSHSAPVIKMRGDAGERQHFELLGVLNSSMVGFWGRQTLHPKGGFASGRWEERLEWDAAKLFRLPLPARDTPLGTRIEKHAQQYATVLPDAIAARVIPTTRILNEAREIAAESMNAMIALQEELDWECYELYGLLDDAPRCEHPPPIPSGQRAFEIILARRIAAGEEESTWFARHGSTPITEIPQEWPAEYREVVQKRIDLIERNRNIALIERPEYKRRWNTERWEKQQERALGGWLLDRLESYFDLDGRMNERKEVTARGDLREPRLTSVAKVADAARGDRDFMQVAEIFTGRMDFDVGSLVSERIAAESVPALPVLRYKPSGLDKRAAWERTWDLQRLEDAVDALFEELTTKARRREEIKIDHPIPSRLRDFVVSNKTEPALREQLEQAAAYLIEAVKQKLDLTTDTILKPVHDAAKRAKKAAVGDIPVPPKYTSADFLSTHHWRLRGKLDVPKERWVSFPHCEGEDATLVIAWAGYDHLQLSRAIAERYELAKEHEGRKLVPLLAAIAQQIPWLKQWHNDLDPAFGTRMGDYFEGYLAEEAKALGMSVEEVMGWTPPERAKKAVRKRKQ